MQIQYHVRLLILFVHMGIMTSPGCYAWIWYCTNIYLVKTAQVLEAFFFVDNWGTSLISTRVQKQGRCYPRIQVSLPPNLGNLSHDVNNYMSRCILRSLSL